MTTLIRLNPTRWPYSLNRLRLDEPSRSFSPDPSDAELAHYGVFRVQPTDAPAPDPATERVVEVAPIETDGEWLQQWEIVELTAEEQEAHYRATHPARWIPFWAALPADVDTLLSTARSVSQRLGASLEVGLGKAADGDSRVFLGAWQQATAIGLVTPELAAGVQALAVIHDLPPEFVAGMGVQS